MQALPLLFVLLLLLGCRPHPEPLPSTMSIHSTLESLCGQLSSPSEDERVSLLNLGVSDAAVSNLLSHWPSGLIGVGPNDMMGIREIIEDELQKNCLKFGLLTVGSCINGDRIAIDISAGSPWPIYYVSHEHSGLYDGSELTKIKVEDSFEKFLVDCDADDDYPCDYFEAEDRLKTDH